MFHSRRAGAVVLGLLALVVSTSPAQAQAIIGSTGIDPFAFYYGYYIPQQTINASRPSPLDTINAVTAARQQGAVTDRATLYDPISPYGDDPDLMDPFSKRGRDRIAKFNGFSSNIRGTGPASHYGRTSGYYPALRLGRGPNRNIAATRARFGGGGGGGMPSMPALGGGGTMGMGMGMGMPSMPGPR
jgi:hypothetical protein